jgi:hypothetical protein
MRCSLDIVIVLIAIVIIIILIILIMIIIIVIIIIMTFGCVPGAGIVSGEVLFNGKPHSDTFW